MAKKKSPKPSPKTSKTQLSNQAYIEKLISDERKNKQVQPSRHKPGQTSTAVERKRTQTSMNQAPWQQEPSPVITILVPKRPSTPRPFSAVSKPQDPLSESDPNRPIFCDRRHVDPSLLTTTIQKPRPRVNLPYKPDQPFRFLDLPGELRNKVYDYVIPSKRFYLNWVGGHQCSKTLTCKRNTVEMIHPSNRRSINTRILDKRSRSHASNDPARKLVMAQIYDSVTPVHLLWVCSKIYPEASSVLYSKSTFVLARLKSMRHFLDRLSPSNRLALTSLDLRYTAYGHPAKTVDQPWKDKHDYAWEKICERVARETSVTHLALEINLNRCPVDFCSLESACEGGEFTRWMMPLWQFIDLKRFECRIRSTIKESAVLEVASQTLRKEVLEDQWEEEAESTKRDAFGFDRRRPIRNCKVLRVT